MAYWGAKHEFPMMVLFRAPTRCSHNNPRGVRLGRVTTPNRTSVPCVPLDLQRAWVSPGSRAGHSCAVVNEKGTGICAGRGLRAKLLDCRRVPDDTSGGEAAALRHRLGDPVYRGGDKSIYPHAT